MWNLKLCERERERESSHRDALSTAWALSLSLSSVWSLLEFHKQHYNENFIRCEIYSKFRPYPCFSCVVESTSQREHALSLVGARNFSGICIILCRYKL